MSTISSRSLLGNDLADLVLDRLEDLLGRLDAGSGRRADMELDLAAVDDGKKSRPTSANMHAAEPEHQHGDDGTMNRRSSRVVEQRDIAVAHALEAALEAGMEAARTSRRRRLVGP